MFTATIFYLFFLFPFCILQVNLIVLTWMINVSVLQTMLQNKSNEDLTSFKGQWRIHVLLAQRLQSLEGYRTLLCTIVKGNCITKVCTRKINCKEKKPITFKPFLIFSLLSFKVADHSHPACIWDSFKRVVLLSQHASLEVKMLDFVKDVMWLL